MSFAYRLNDVHMVYDNRTVLNVGELCVVAGDFFAIVGPSGAGKSTLLRILGLLESPTRGEIEITIGGRLRYSDAITLREQRQVAMVFQRPFLMSRSVWYNVAYGLKIRGRNDRQLIGDILERVSMSHLADAHAHTLSGGEMQRVAIARALVLEPEILLLDEPTANLDPFNVRIIEQLISEQHQQRKTTIVMVTHNIFQAQRLATQVGFVLDGTLVEVAPSQQFFASPSDPRTRAFVSGDFVY